MKIIVLGAGMVGSAMAVDLAKDHEVTCADINEDTLHALGAKYKIDTLKCDFSKTNEIAKCVASFDLVIGAVPGFLGFNMLNTVIEAGKNIVDISFFSEDAFLLDELAKKNNVTAIVDCGVAPGMCNIIAGYHNSLQPITFYECLVGGLPVVRTKPFEYKAPFSPIDVLEEYTRPARYVENGIDIIKEALTDVEQINFDGVGTLEAFNTDGLRSLLLTMPHVKNLKEKTLRYPGHADLMRGFRETGFFSKEKIKIKGAEVVPIELVSKLLFEKWKYHEGEEEFTVMRVVIDADKRYVYHLLDRTDKETSTSSMARTTGYTCTAAANLILKNKFNRKGICPPEYIGEDKECFDFMFRYLRDRNINYVLSTEPLQSFA
jgi:lysine 6-dehydrogenase